MALAADAAASTLAASTLVASPPPSPRPAAEPKEAADKTSPLERLQQVSLEAGAAVNQFSSDSLDVVNKGAQDAGEALKKGASVTYDAIVGFLPASPLTSPQSAKDAGEAMPEPEPPAVALSAPPPMTPEKLDPQAAPPAPAAAPKRSWGACILFSAAFALLVAGAAFAAFALSPPPPPPPKPVEEDSPGYLQLLGTGMVLVAVVYVYFFGFTSKRAAADGGDTDDAVAFGSRPPSRSPSPARAVSPPTTRRRRAREE